MKYTIDIKNIEEIYFWHALILASKERHTHNGR